MRARDRSSGTSRSSAQCVTANGRRSSRGSHQLCEIPRQRRSGVVARLGMSVAQSMAIGFRSGGMGILTWIIVGLVAGVLASFVMGGTGYGLIGDIIIGIIGAFVGNWIFGHLGAGVPFGGLGGIIFVAFIGAVVLLFLLRLVRRA